MKPYQTIINEICFNADGLVPAIAQDADSKQVLMMAWMNEEAVIETLSTNRACYFSRSRNQLWRKGESSGQVQDLVSFNIDCDGDTLLLEVKQKGVACHTGRKTCFFRKVENDGLIETQKVEISPENLYGRE